MPILRPYKPNRIGLFGSVAMGTSKKGSDIDILIDLPKSIGLFTFVGIKQKLEAALRREVDLVEYQAIKPVLKKNVMAQHLQLYEKRR